MTMIRATSLSVTQGQTTITATGSQDFSKVQPSSFIVFDGVAALLKITAGTAPDGGGNSTITLAEAYPNTLANVTVGNATIGIGYDALADVTQRLKDSTDYTNAIAQALNDYATTNNDAYPMPLIGGGTQNQKTIPAMQEDFDTLFASLQAEAGNTKTTKIADHIARRNTNRNQYAASGFVEFGRHRSNATDIIQKGLWSNLISNKFHLGRLSSDLGVGDSRTDTAIINIDGVTINLAGILVNAESQSDLLLPPAPTAAVEASTTTANPHDKYDFVVTGNDVYIAIQDAPAGTSLTNPTYYEPRDHVARADLVIFEVFKVPVTGAGKRPYYPHGMVQNSLTSQSGVTMSATSGLGISGVDAGYCRFGEWDSATDGKGVDFEGLSQANKDALANLGDLDNGNLHVEDGVYYQWHVRAKAIRGAGTEWLNVDPFDTAIDYLQYNGTNATAFVAPQGMQNTPTDYNASWPTYVTVDSGHQPAPTTDAGVFKAANGSGSTYGLAGVDGECYAIPVALVSRRNFGAYHPFLNSLGTKFCAATPNTAQLYWYDASVTYTTTAECFSTLAAVDSGTVATSGAPRPDNKVVDAIYEGDVLDLRLSARELNQHPNKTLQDLVANATRGWEGLPELQYLTANNVTYKYRQTGGIWYLYSDDVDTTRHTTRSHALIHDQTNGEFLFGRVASTSSTYLGIDPNHPETVGTLTDTSVLSGDANVVNFYVIYESDIKFATHSVTDFIGDPANLKTIMDGYGVTSILGARWIPVVPDGTNKEHKANRKITSSVVNQYDTSDNGATWSAATANAMTGATNSLTSGQAAATVRLYAYTTPAYTLEPAAQVSVDDSFLSDVVAFNSHVLNFGSVTCSNLTGFVSVGATAPIQDRRKLESWVINSDTGQLSTYEPEHNTIDLGGTSDGVKAFTYHHTDSNGIEWGYVVGCSMVYDSGASNVDGVITAGVSFSASIGDVYRLKGFTDSALNGMLIKFISDRSTTTWSSTELDGYYVLSDGITIHNNAGFFWGQAEVWQSTGFGDDNKFPIVNNVTTDTDDNGNIRIVSCMKIKQPLGFGR